MYVKCVLVILIHLLWKCRMEPDNYSQYKVTAFNENERSILYMFHVKVDDIIFLNSVTNDASIPMDIILSESYTDEFERMLKRNDIEYYNIDASYLNENYKSMTDPENKLYPYKETINISKGFLNFNTFSAWAKGMCRKYIPLQQIKIGETYEKRDILVLKLSTGVKKPAVFILGGEQGRDWISPAIIINYIQMIVNEKPSSETLSDLYDFYFLPIFNPDGYNFSMEEVLDEMTKLRCLYSLQNILWNKNRKPFFPKKMCHNNEPGAIGVNIDRNFYFTRTSSSDECDSVHPGHTSISEEESLSLASFLNSIAFNMMAFINLRGFESIVTIPYDSPTMFGNNHAIVYEILDFSINKANVKFNTNIKFETTAKTFYNFSGNIPDWVKRKFNTPLVFTEYITNEKKYFPGVEDIIPLTNQFAFIIEETLMLSNRIYRPLFNKQVFMVCNHSLLLFCCILLYILFFRK